MLLLLLFCLDKHPMLRLGLIASGHKMRQVDAGDGHLPAGQHMLGRGSDHGDQAYKQRLSARKKKQKDDEEDEHRRRSNEEAK